MDYSTGMSDETKEYASVVTDNLTAATKVLELISRPRGLLSTLRGDDEYCCDGNAGRSASQQVSLVGSTLILHKCNENMSMIYRILQ